MDMESRSTPAQRDFNEQPVFSYSSLSNPRDIRLIKVDPGAWTGPIRYQVSHFYLDHQPQYVALSYTWGDATKCRSVYTQSGYINITESLHSALQHLRRSFGRKEPVVWADAVCINQEDNKEKAMQVQLMGDIYTAATATIVFLGEKKDDSDIASEVLFEELEKTSNMDSAEPALWLNDLGTALRSVSDPSRMPFLTPFHTGFAARLREKDMSQEEYEKKIASLKAFFRRPWYNRAWIQQEVLLQANVHTLCGEWDGPLDRICRATAAILREGSIWAHVNASPGVHLGVIALLDLGIGRMLRMIGLESGSLHDLLYLSTQTRKASRARDHIFTLTSLAKDGKDKAYLPDYEAPIEVIVKRVVNHIFLKTKDPLLFVARAGLGPDPNRFPSWMPNLLEGKDNRGAPHFNRHWKFCAAADTQTVVKLDAERSELAVSSAYWDTVTDVGEVYLNARLSCIRDAEQFFGQVVTYPTGEDMGAVKLKTMIGNYICDGETLEDIRTMYETWLLLEMNPVTNVNDPDTFPKKAIEAGWMFSSRCILHGTRLAVTQHGYVGVVPER